MQNGRRHFSIDYQTRVRRHKSQAHTTEIEKAFEKSTQDNQVIVLFNPINGIHARKRIIGFINNHGAGGLL